MFGSLQGNAAMNHDDLGNYSHTYVKSLQNQLTAAQARIIELESALETFCNSKTDEELLKAAVLAVRTLKKGTT